MVIIQNRKLFDMNEIWKPLTLYNGYEVSNMGRVRSIDREYIDKKGIKQTFKGRILTPIKQKNGYLNVLISQGGKFYKVSVHRLVAMAFIPNIKNKPQVNHKDEDKTNNRADNLEWCTSKENINYGDSLDKRIKAQRVAIIQFDLDGNFIKEWQGVALAARTLKISESQISGCLSGIYKSAQGFRWLYKSSYEKGECLPKYINLSAKKPIGQYTKQGILIKEWSSIIDAAKGVGVTKRAIQLSLHRKDGTCKGCIWRLL